MLYCMIFYLNHKEDAQISRDFVRVVNNMHNQSAYRSVSAQNIIFFVQVADNMHCHCALNKNLVNMSVL
jgi:hypothetical protein